MSRTVRKQLFSLMDSLFEASELLKKLINENKNLEILQLLHDCQECAIVIGNQIEMVYGEGTQSVHELECYCESVYQLSQNLQNSIERDKWFKDLCGQYNNARKYMNHDLPDRLEVVFLPYKASMWDSLESVWLAARGDKDCDEYVIPIPYYDKNPDGTFRNEYWEKDEFPQYVPVTMHNEYDFRIRKPDIVYIHNPYDDGNHVTSVHPFYYSENLKKFSDVLVYCPYFLCLDNISEDMCICKGIIYSDIVALQSVDIAEQYKKTWSKCLKLNDLENKFNSKFQVLGSPKVEGLLERKAVHILQEWKNIMSNKKIVLCNTHILMLLSNPNKYLDKLEKAFEQMYHIKGICILWRPHPLIEQTLKAMRPEYEKKYVKLVQRFKQECWGIIDNTPDIQRAIIISDAYYGDISSLVPLYGVTGKPILIMSLEKENQIVNNESIEDYFLKRSKDKNMDFVYWESSKKDLNCFLQKLIETDTGISELPWVMNRICNVYKNCGKDIYLYAKEWGEITR